MTFWSLDHMAKTILERACSARRAWLDGMLLNHKDKP